MPPDIVVRRGAQPALAIDCKYKRLDHGQYRNHDQYQLHAYCTALGVSRGALVYPRHEDAVDTELRVRSTEIRLRQCSLDLGGDRMAFAASCREFVVWVAVWSGEASAATAPAWFLGAA